MRPAGDPSQLLAARVLPQLATLVDPERFGAGVQTMAGTDADGQLHLQHCPCAVDPLRSLVDLLDVAAAVRGCCPPPASAPAAPWYARVLAVARLDASLRVADLCDVATFDFSRWHDVLYGLHSAAEVAGDMRDLLGDAAAASVSAHLDDVQARMATNPAAARRATAALAGYAPAGRRAARRTIGRALLDLPNAVKVPAGGVGRIASEVADAVAYSLLHDTTDEQASSRIGDVLRGALPTLPAQTPHPLRIYHDTYETLARWPDSAHDVERSARLVVRAGTSRSSSSWIGHVLLPAPAARPVGHTLPTWAATAAANLKAAVDLGPVPAGWGELTPDRRAELIQVTGQIVSLNTQPKASDVAAAVQAARGALGLT